MLSRVTHTRVADDIYAELYSKLIVNACITSLGAICGLRLGEMMKTSHDGDRVGVPPITDERLDALAVGDVDVARESGSYACSTPRIDELCDLLNATPGVLGSQLVGAGLGGCVVALVEKAHAAEVIAALNRHYYDAHDLPHSAAVYVPSCGASVIY